MAVSDELTGYAASWARIAIQVLQTPYPYASGHVATGPQDTDVTPQRLHPAFHGALDWHSSVHMQYSLLRMLRTCGEALADGGVAEQARELLAARLTPQTLAVEVDYLRERPTFERPYGWAWALQLAAEARHHPDLVADLTPLAQVVGDNTLGWLPRQAYPIRHGKHQNDAFALTLMLEAAGEDALAQPELAHAIRSRALDWFVSDRAMDTSAEPSGSDFLSPVLSEAVLMRRVLGDGFDSWWRAFLPGLGVGEDYRNLLEAPTVLDGSDGQFVHLAGLALSRAWQLRELAAVSAAPEVLQMAAGRQVHGVLPLITGGDFMATHWLVSFALLATDGLSTAAQVS